jgi:hypothetical protein
MTSPRWQGCCKPQPRAACGAHLPLAVERVSHRAGQDKGPRRLRANGLGRTISALWAEPIVARRRKHVSTSSKGMRPRGIRSHRIIKRIRGLREPGSCTVINAIQARREFDMIHFHIQTALDHPSKHVIGSRGAFGATVALMTNKARRRHGAAEAPSHHRLVTLVIAMFLCLLGSCGQLTYAQNSSGSITGVVTDPSGAVIPGAKVTARDTAKGFTYTSATNAAGLYTIGSLPPGNYAVSITASGFKTENRPGVTLVVNQHATVNVTMTVGATSQSVTVSGAPPLLEAQDATTGLTVDRTFVDDLPLVGRDLTDLAFLAPGVTPSVGQSLGQEHYANNFDSNGGRTSTADVLLDGISNSAPQNNPGDLDPLYTPSIEAVQEFKIEQNGFGADIGFGGNTVMSVIMRSGTNQFHGDVYEFLRNGGLNANNWFNNRAGIPIPGSRENDFGFTFGGPIQKDKTFFFVDFEGTRSASAAAFSAGVPDMAERNGDFSGICAYYKGAFNSSGQCSAAQGQLWDPYSAIYNAKTGVKNLTAIIPNNNMAAYTSPGAALLAGTPFQPAATPGNLIDPVAAKMITYYPMPNLNVGTSAYNPYNNWAGAGSNPSSSDQGDIKVDRQISDMTHFMARFSMRGAFTTTANPWNNPLFPDSTGPDTTGVVSAEVHLTHNFSPTFLVDASYGYTREAGNRGGVDASFPSFNAVKDLGLAPNLGTSGINIAPAIRIETNYISAGGSNASLGATTSAVIVDRWEVHDPTIKFDKISGRHEFQFGGEMRMFRTNYVQWAYPAGEFEFTNTGTSQTTSATSGGDAVASFLTGFPSQGDYEINPALATQSFDYAGYFQDNWHTTNKLTLNLGLRYELQLPLTERFNRQEWINPTAVSPLSGQVSLSSSAAAVYSAAGLPVPDLSTVLGGLQYASPSERYPVNPDFAGGIQPRFGFAYRLTNNTVVRGGYGIFDDPVVYAAEGTFAGIDGFQSETSLVTTYQDNGYTPFGRLSNPWPTGLLPPSGSSLGLSTDLGISAGGWIRNWNQTPYEQDWNLGLQHQFGSVLVDAEYIGAKGTHLYFGGNQGEDYFGNWIQSVTPAQLTALDTKVANPFYGKITTPGCSICGSTITAYDLLEPYPQFSAFPGSEPPPPWANSEYNAFQLKVEKRFSHGLDLLADYTWSKSLDDSSTEDSANAFEAGTYPTAQDPNDLEAEYALSEYDEPQVLTFAYVYQLPFGRGERWGHNWNRFTDALLGGWQTNGFWTFQSGQPLDVTLTSGLSVPWPTWGPQRPNLTGTLLKNNGSETSRVAQYFGNPGVLTQPPEHALGTAPRALSVLGPGIENADLSVFKNFPIHKLGESGMLQFRIETFNALNYVQFADPNLQVGSTTFGEITSQLNSPREVQIAAKLYW